MSTSARRKLENMPPGLRAEELKMQMVRASAAMHFIDQQRKQLDTQENNVRQSMRNLAELARADGQPRRRIASALAISVTDLGDLTGWDVSDLLAENAELAQRMIEKKRA